MDGTYMAPGCGPRPDELEDIIRAIQVVDVLDSICSSKMAVDSALIGAEVILQIMSNSMKYCKSLHVKKFSFQ